MVRLSIVIPAHNEENRIERTLNLYISFFDKLKKQRKLDYELVIVVNNSKDNTLNIVKSKSEKNKNLKYLNLVKGGKGYAVVEGFKYSLKRKNDYIGFVDADASTLPEYFYDLLVNIDGMEGAIASRWMKESNVKTKQSFLRRVTSRTFNFIVRSLFLMTYRDTQCGAKLFRKKELGKIISQIGNTKWAFDVELLYKFTREGYKIREVPTTWEDSKDTKLNLIKAPFEMFTGVLRLRLINSPFNFMIRAYDVLPEYFKIHHRII